MEAASGYQKTFAATALSGPLNKFNKSIVLPVYFHANCGVGRDFVLLGLDVGKLAKPSYQYSRDFSQSEIRAVQCHDCPTARCGSADGT